jgi:hypothetical protein
VRSVANQYLGISRLTPDLANTTGVCAVLPQSEAPALFTHRGRHYLLASHLTGWCAAGRQWEEPASSERPCCLTPCLPP